MTNKKININGRAISFSMIKEQRIVAQSEGEQHVFDFISQWLSGQQKFIINTSGSTGKPKPISIQRRQMEISAQKTGTFLGLKKNDSTLICLSAEHIAGKMMLVRTLELGLIATYVDPCSNPFEKVNQSFDFTALVPLQVQNIVDNATTKKAFYNTQYIIIGGAPLSSSLEHQLLNSPNNIYQTYGMTETVSHVALKNVSKGQQAYQALPDVIFDLDQRGCLKLNAPMATPNEQITNDVVQLHSPTSFTWKGRIDFVINTGGIKVQTEELEQKIHHILQDQNFNFFIFPKADDQLGEKICICFEANTIDDNLLDVLKEKLPPFHGPKELYLLEQFSYTKTGKLDRVSSIKKLQ